MLLNFMKPKQGLILAGGAWGGSLRSSLGEESGPSSVPFVLPMFNKQLWLLQMVVCMALEVEKAAGRQVKRESM